MSKIKLLNGFSLLLVITILQTNFAKAQMVGPDAYIKATSVEVGINGIGGYEGVNTTSSPTLPGMHPRSGTGYFGFVANPHLDAWATFDGDFFTPGDPENGWGFEIGVTGGIKASNNCASAPYSPGTPQGIPGALTSWTHVFNCYSADWQGDYLTGTNLHFKINYFLQETDLYYTTTVSITNNTAANIPDMYYYRNVDPDNNEANGSTDAFTTTNTIISQPGTGCDLAHVSATQTSPWNSYLGFAAVGANWRADWGGFTNRDASDLWTGTGFTQTIGASLYADQAMSLAYRIQNLAPGATSTFKFVVILDAASASQAINNLLYLTYPGSLGAPPAVCVPYADTIRTCGGPVPVQVTGVTATDFTWVWSPAAGLSGTTGTSVVANPASTTTYTASGTPTSACVAPITLTFVVEVTPATGANPVITAVPALCITHPPFNLTVDSLGGTWYGTGITNPSTGTFSPAAAGVGTTLITYTRPGLCNTTDTVLITVDSMPNPAISPVPPICIGDAAFNLSAVSGGGIWSGSGITNSSSGTFDPSTVTAGPHLITYSFSSACLAVDTVTVNVVITYDATITPHPDVCVGSPPFNFSGATSGVGGVWSGTGITNDSLGTFNPATAGTFPITYTIPGICASSNTYNMTVLPYANATITAVPPVCANSPSFNLSGVTPGGVWSGTGITNPSAGTFTPTIAGSFLITYSIAGMCGDTATKTVVVRPLPTPSFTSNLHNICSGKCVDFSDITSPLCTGVVYHFGDGDSALTSNPTHCYTSPGAYSVSLQCTDANGCIGTISYPSLINVIAIPVANFTMSPSVDLEPGAIVNFTNTSSASGVFSFWSFGDVSGGNDTSFLTSPSHTYNTEGDYCITLVSSNSAAPPCTDTAKYCLVVIGEGTLMIPNIFTPNGDGNNDIFIVGNHDMKEIYYEIYDRWGLKIAEYNGLTGGWDGHTKNGKMASDGTYYYILNATAINGKTVKKDGFIQLLSK